MNEESSMTRKSFGLPDDIAKNLEKSAERCGISVSKKIRKAIDTQLELEEIQEKGGRIIVVETNENPYLFDPTAD